MTLAEYQETETNLHRWFARGLLSDKEYFHKMGNLILTAGESNENGKNYRKNGNTKNNTKTKTV